MSDSEAWKKIDVVGTCGSCDYEGIKLVLEHGFGYPGCGGNLHIVQYCEVCVGLNLHCHNPAFTELDTPTERASVATRRGTAWATNHALHAQAKKKATSYTLRETKAVPKITNCARCGGDHVDMVFYKLTFPVVSEADENVWTHWSPCPTNQEPILLLITPDPAEPAQEGDNEHPA